uniref:C2H2-type domain-containing protein n=1 Tax=Palpitomonas bilix TaxID=652834 RepID=A0A7S3LSN4_9EUKA|mmetsp:Transcript_44604/g.115963  ORF Transcript_44604/g.115963 Transcript_44604/m.115963 type:complete len:448 (+) Transcript_44604:180-1523(+)
MSAPVDPRSAAMTCRSCKAVFDSADSQREHYKSEWHAYNLKRKVSGMGPITFQVFKAKLEQARAAQDAEKSKEKPPKKGKKAEKRRRQEGDHVEEKKMVEEPPQPEKTQEEIMEERMRLAKPIALPSCLFCGDDCGNLEGTFKHMQLQHNFFVPYKEYLADAEGLFNYLGKKIGVGYACSLCNRSFTSVEAVRKHMTDKSHTRMEFNADGGEYSDFFDFRSSYPDYDPNAPSDEEEEEVDEEEMEGDEDMEEDWDSDGEWEEAGDEDIVEMEAEGTLPNDIGEVVISEESQSKDRKKKISRKAVLSTKAHFTHGGMFVEIYDPETKTTRRLGHRSLQQYFKQNFRQKDERAPVLYNMLDKYRQYGFEGQVKDLANMNEHSRERKLMMLDEKMKGVSIVERNFRQKTMQLEQKVREKDRIKYQSEAHKLKRGYTLSKRSGQQNVGVHG